MSQPEIFAKEPKMMELEAGQYYWCACGRSKDGVFCDGSHEGTGIAPEAFEIKQKQTVAICLCKHTKNPPFCDGSHAEL